MRGIVGMDEPAVRAECSAVPADTTLNSVQIQFVDLLVGYIARNGVLETAELTRPPFDEYGNVVDIFRTMRCARHRTGNPPAKAQRGGGFVGALS